MMDLDRVNAYMARVEESETKTFRPVSGKLKVGLDLGTAYIVMVVLDEEDNPIACEKQAAQVLRDGVVVDYTGALRIVKELKAKLEERLGTDLLQCRDVVSAQFTDTLSESFHNSITSINSIIVVLIVSAGCLPLWCCTT